MATLTERLAEAEAAYHDLQTGRMARVFVDQNGERVEYVAANRAGLAAYIRELKALIANDGAAPCEGPMRPFFI